MDELLLKVGGKLISTNKWTVICGERNYGGGGGGKKQKVQSRGSSSGYIYSDMFAFLYFITSTNTYTEQNATVSYYKKTPICFGTEMPSSEGRSVQRNVGQPRQSSYDVALMEVTEILNIKILNTYN
jgi:hypothetical protein